MASVNSGSSAKVTTPPKFSYNLTSVQISFRLTVTYLEVASDSVLKPFGMTISNPQHGRGVGRSHDQHQQQSCADLCESRFNSALENARVAEAEAQRALFERFMVGRIYSPDEHKEAFYLQLQGPIAVPLITTAIREIKMVRAGR
jgi:hypothetical protein